MNDEDAARVAETIDDDVEIYEGAPEFEVSPTQNVNPDNSVQDDLNVEVQEVPNA